MQKINLAWDSNDRTRYGMRDAGCGKIPNHFPASRLANRWRISLAVLLVVSLFGISKAWAGDPVKYEERIIGGITAVDSCVDDGSGIAEQPESVRDCTATCDILNPMNGSLFARIWVNVPTSAKGTCGWDCDPVNPGMEVPMAITQPPRPTRWPCHNPCEQCCPYYFYVENWRTDKKITDIQLCTDRGCGATPTTPLYFCRDTSTSNQDRSDHICMLCTVLKWSDGLGLAGWSERIDSCPRVQPSGIGADTMLTGGGDSLCISNCLRLQANGTASRLAYNDTIRIHLGLTGQCKTATFENGQWDPPVPDTLSAKCVWVCVTWEDGVTLCCMVKVRDCECIIGPCNCDPRRCDHDIIFNNPPGGD